MKMNYIKMIQKKKKKKEFIKRIVGVKINKIKWTYSKVHTYVHHYFIIAYAVLL